MMALYGWFKKEGSPEFSEGLTRRPAPKSKGPEHYMGATPLGLKEENEEIISILETLTKRAEEK